MKKFLLIVILIIVCNVSSHAQNIIIQQNNQQHEKVIVKEKEVPVPIYIKEERQGPICLHGYLYVYPEDLGSFNWYPRDMVNAINASNAYGRSNWRLPTFYELKIIKENREKVGGFFKKYSNAIDSYMYNNNGWICIRHYDSHKRIDGEFEYRVRLVSSN